MTPSPTPTGLRRLASLTLSLLAALLAAALGGALLSLADHPFGLWWLQLVAFVPFLAALAHPRIPPVRAGWLVGLAFGGAYAAILLQSAGMSPPIQIAAGMVVLQWMLLAPLLGRSLQRGTVSGAAAAAAWVTLFELAVWHGLPLFGAGQCFARPFAHAPQVVAFAAWTGLASVVFALVFTQGLAVLAARRRTPRAGAALVATVGVLALAAWAAAPGGAHGTLRVAVAGWTGPRPAVTEMFAAAAADGAALVVIPETAVSVHDLDRARAEWGPIAAQHGIAAVLGAWVAASGDNRALLFDRSGELVGSYAKTHLVPVFEDYPTGDGAPVVRELAGTGVGAMICQDDNFTDVARGIAADGARLIAIPSNDWPAVAPFHLANSIFRAIETGCALARATSNGSSALVAPGGRVVATADHLVGGYRLLTADVPLGSGTPTLHARLGDWPMFVGCASLLVLLGMGRRGSRTRP